MNVEWVWIFNGDQIQFPSAVFEDKNKAELWIKQFSLCGTLTKYPVNVSAYDWALEHNLFKIKKEHQKTPDFVGCFTAGFIDHEHYNSEHVPVISLSSDTAKMVNFAVCAWLWIFNGDGGSFSSGVFENQYQAELWIKRYSLNGTLSKYPVGISVYTWAIQNKIFIPKDEAQRGSAFISKFGWGYVEHIHYKNGLRWGNEEIA